MRTRWPNCATQLELDTAGDRAAVLDWRLDDTRLHNSLAPLPWLPGIPDRIANNPDWAHYLAARAQLINDLADQVCATGEAATWADEQARVLPAGLITDLEVWRAAMRSREPTCGQLGLSNEVFWRGPGSTDSIGDSASTTRLKISNGRNCSPS
jgi:hypothetical protein